MSIKRNFIYNALLNVANIAFPIVTIPYVSRILGVEQIGIFNFVITFVSYFVAFAALGTPLYGMREIAKLKEDTEARDTLFNEIFSICILSSAAVSAVYLLLVYNIPRFADIRTFLTISGITVFLSFLNIDWFFSGLENFRLLALRSVIVKLLGLLCLFLFVTTPEDLINYFWIFVFTTIGNQIWNVYSLRLHRIRIRFTCRCLIKHLKPLFILLVSAVAVHLYIMLDTLMLGLMRDYEEVGIYSSAVKSVRLIMPLVTALGVVLLPRLSYYKEKSREEMLILLNKSFQYINIVSIPLSIYFICIASRFVPFFFGANFYDTIVPMRVVSLLIFLGNLSYFFSVQILAVLSHENKFLTATVAGMLINFLFNCFLIPAYGAIGAGIASIIGELSVTLCAGWFVYRLYPLKLNWKQLLQYTAASVLFPVFYYLMRYWTVSDFVWLCFYSFITWMLYGISLSFVFRNGVMRDLLCHIVPVSRKIFR